MSSPAPLPRARWKRWLPWTLGTLLVLAVAAFIAGKLWADSYLRSDRFRAFIGRKLGDTLQASAEVAPFQFAGGTIFSDGLKARGTEKAWFSEMQLDQVRAEVSARRVLERVWQVETLAVQRAQIDFEGSRVVLPEPVATPEPSQHTSFAFGRNWLPNRVELGSATVADSNLRWRDGALAGTRLDIAPHDGGWNLTGAGGTVRHAAWPELEVAALKLRYREPSLFVQSAELRQSGGGSLVVTGEVRPEESVDLTAKGEGVTVTPLLPPDWRARLHGQLAGEVRVQSPLPVRGAPLLSGTVSLHGGQLEALPVLEEIAAFTRTAQFRKLALSRASGDFQHDGATLSVKNFAVESEGLIRMEGAFTVVQEQIDGTFQVGVTPASLQWLPGSQERVFTAARGGYLWTPMRLTGPIAKPQEDLTPRLIAAAQNSVIDRAEGMARDAVKGARDAAKGALDFLFGK